MGKNLTRIVMLCGLLAVLLSATAWAVVSSATLSADTDEADAELMAANVTYQVDGGYLYFDATNGEITDCDETVTKAEIPSEIYGISVTKIGFFAFSDCTQLTDVIIPDSITYLDAGAFSGCKKVKKLNIAGIPAGDKVFDKKAFDSVKFTTK